MFTEVQKVLNKHCKGKKLMEAFQDEETKKLILKDIEDAMHIDVGEVATLLGADAVFLHIGNKKSAFEKMYQCSVYDLMAIYESAAEDIITKINPNTLKGLAAFAGGGTSSDRPVDNEGNPLMSATDVARAMKAAIDGIPTKYQDMIKAKVEGHLKMKSKFRKDDEDDMIDELLK